MENLPIAPVDDAELRRQEMLAHYDAPAYVRRARRVEDAWDELVRRCQTRREEWLLMPRLAIGRLARLAPGWTALAPWLADEEQLAVLRELHDTLAPQLRVVVPASDSPRVLRAGLTQLVDAIERFNARWRKFVEGVDLSRVNALRADYNRYYLLEKECAVRSPRVARQGYRPLPLLSSADLLVELPLLPVVRWRDAK